MVASSSQGSSSSAALSGDASIVARPYSVTYELIGQRKLCTLGHRQGSPAGASAFKNIAGGNERPRWRQAARRLEVAVMGRANFRRPRPNSCPLFTTGPSQRLRVSAPNERAGAAGCVCRRESYNAPWGQRKESSRGAGGGLHATERSQRRAEILKCLELGFGRGAAMSTQAQKSMFLIPVRTRRARLCQTAASISARVHRLVAGNRTYFFGPTSVGIFAIHLITVSA